MLSKLSFKVCASILATQKQATLFHTTEMLPENFQINLIFIWTGSNVAFGCQQGFLCWKLTSATIFYILSQFCLFVCLFPQFNNSPSYIKTKLSFISKSVSSYFKNISNMALCHINRVFVKLLWNCFLVKFFFSPIKNFQGRFFILLLLFHIIYFIISHISLH